MSDLKNASTGLTPEEGQEIKDAFQLFDRNDDKKISRTELGPVLRAMGQNPSQKLIEQYLCQAGVNEKGFFTYEEFIKLVDDTIMTPQELEVQLREAFRVFDKDRDGFLDSKEMHRVLTTMGEVLTEEEAEQILKLADSNKDGKLNADEFTQFLCQRI